MSTPLSPQSGFTYIGLLVMIVIMGLGLTVVGRVWSTTAQRERETQLLFVGHAFRTAIFSYYQSGHRFPSDLKELVQDDRFPIAKRHLRRIYVDPITGQADWTLILTPDGQSIMGVASSSQRAPIKRAGFDSVDDAFKDTDCYCAWQFVYFPSRFNRTTRTSGTSTLSPHTLGSFSPGNLTTLPPDSTTPSSGSSTN